MPVIQDDNTGIPVLQDGNTGIPVLQELFDHPQQDGQSGSP